MRFGEVGLALAVETDDRSRARLEVERRADVVAEVDELQPSNDHDCRTRGRTRSPSSAANTLRDRERRRGAPATSAVTERAARVSAANGRQSRPLIYGTRTGINRYR